MTRVEASWQDEAGTLRTVPACMEVKSVGGACIRVQKPIGVGSKLSIRWRFETFTGTARNCRGEGQDYLVGIQRDGPEAAVVNPPVLPTIALPIAPSAEPVRSIDPPLSPAAAAAAWTARMRSLRKPQENKLPQNKPQELEPRQSNPQESPPREISVLHENQRDEPREVPPTQKRPEIKAVDIPVVHESQLRESQQSNRSAPLPALRKVPTVPFQRIAGRATPFLPRRVDNETRIRDGPAARRSPGPEPARLTELPWNQTPQGKDIGNERKRMRPKWLGLAPWQNKQDALSESRNGNRTTPGNSNDEGEKENFMPHATPPTSTSTATSTNMSMRKTPADSLDDSAPFQVDLLPMDDIYRAAGIMSPPKGYGIKKVVDMLNSEYVRALSKDLKRAAVLMALDAAGVPINQLQQDARARQDALDSYEAAQRKQVEAEWARKAEENVQIQAELERVKAHHQARIARNLDAIEREKATFSSWLAIKQQETHSMLEAAELCLKAPAPEPGTKSQAGKSEASANPTSDPAKDLLADASLAKAAAAGSKPM